MVKLNRLIFLLFGGLFLFYCSDVGYLPPDLYGYQVKRLLSADSTKTWTVSSLTISGDEQDLDDCEDGILLKFDEVNDSIDVSWIFNTCSEAEMSEVYVGRALPTSINRIFSDSLFFTNGGVWYVDQVTSKTAEIYSESTANPFRANLVYP